jgi:hypothetical protein
VDARKTDDYDDRFSELIARANNDYDKLNAFRPNSGAKSMESTPR